MRRYLYQLWAACRGLMALRVARLRHALSALVYKAGEWRGR
jgi:hypothetical protein